MPEKAANTQVKAGGPRAGGARWMSIEKKNACRTGRSWIPPLAKKR
jgi:hypothetical protein